MRRTLAVLGITFSFAFSVPLSAKDVYLGISGSVGVFRTDARILNPSSQKDIVVAATFIPVQGNSAGAATVNVTIPKRQMRVLDDIVTTLFAKTGLGAIKLSSPDDFVATSRIYATVANGTTGQFVQGVDATAALTRGVILQMKSTGTSAVGTFRTNIGFVNIGAGAATIALRLHDKNNAVVSTQSISLPAGGALSPVNYFASATGDFSDAWASFESNQPLIAYGSVVDNGTTDPTFIAASPDSGSELPTNNAKIIEIKARQWDFSPATIRVKVGDRVTLRIESSDVTHGFSMSPYVTNLTLPRGDEKETTFVADQAGTFPFFCTNFCGEGHTTMAGTMIVEP